MNLSEEEVRHRWIELGDRAVFRLTGPDRVRYLNGQVTNDVEKLNGRNALPACVCGIKGKVEFLIWMTATADSILIDGQLDQREELQTRLDRYLIADDCELSDETGSWRLLHHFDPRVGGVASRRLSVEGFDLWLPPGRENPLQSDCAMDQKTWDLFALRSLVPEAPYEITGTEFPAELRLDQWAVDFQKGCYLGQEVISRIESVGRVRRKLSLISVEKPLAQNAIVRNGEGVEARTTRATQKNFDGQNIGFAFFPTSGIETECVPVQRVAEY